MKLPNRPQFFIAYNLIDHWNDVNNVQNLSETKRFLCKVTVPISEILNAMFSPTWKGLLGVELHFMPSLLLITLLMIMVLDQWVHGNFYWQYLLTSCITVSFIDRTANHSVTTGITQHMIFFNLKVVTITVLDLCYAKQTKRNSRIVDVFICQEWTYHFLEIFGLNLIPFIHTHSNTQNVYFLNIHRHCGSSSQAARETN